MLEKPAESGYDYTIGKSGDISMRVEET